MTSPNTKPPNPDPDTESRAEPTRLSLSFTQVLASVLAAVSASIAASVFGVAGTVIGAALGSAISVVGGAVYAQSLERSRQAVRLTVGVAAARRQGGRAPVARRDPDSPDNPAGSPGSPAPSGRRHRLRLVLTPQRLALGAGALFVLTMGLITGFELLTGQPVAASVEGKQGSGVSVLGGTERSDPSTAPAPASTAPPSAPATSTATTTVPSSTAPSSSAPGGTSRPTPTVTVTVTPSATPTPSPTDTAPTGSDAASSSPVGEGSSTPTSGG